MVAVADAHPPGMSPDSGGHEQEAQARRRQRGVPHGLHRGARLAVEQLQPSSSGCRPASRSGTVGVHPPAVGGMRRQHGIVVGFLHEVLRSGALVIEPQQPIQRPVHVGHKERLRPVAA